jgi:hypothetical protein
MKRFVPTFQECLEVKTLPKKCPNGGALTLAPITASASENGRVFFESLE